MTTTRSVPFNQLPKELIERYQKSTIALLETWEELLEETFDLMKDDSSEKVMEGHAKLKMLATLMDAYDLSLKIFNGEAKADKDTSIEEMESSVAYQAPIHKMIAAIKDSNSMFTIRNGGLDFVDTNNTADKLMESFQDLIKLAENEKNQSLSSGLDPKFKFSSASNSNSSSSSSSSITINSDLDSINKEVKSMSVEDFSKDVTDLKDASAKLLNQWRQLKAKILTSVLKEETPIGFIQVQPLMKEIDEMISPFKYLQSMQAYQAKSQEEELISHKKDTLKMISLMSNMLTEISKDKSPTAYESLSGGLVIPRNKYAVALEKGLAKSKQKIAKTELFEDNKKTSNCIIM